MKKTRALTRVAQVLLANPDARHWGYELGRASGTRSGVMYPILARLLAAGWLVDGWEDLAERGPRPPRRYYRLTPAGRAGLREMVGGAGAPTSVNV